MRAMCSIFVHTDVDNTLSGFAQCCMSSRAALPTRTQRGARTCRCGGLWRPRRPAALPGGRLGSARAPGQQQGLAEALGGALPLALLRLGAAPAHSPHGRSHRLLAQAPCGAGILSACPGAPAATPARAACAPPCPTASRSSRLIRGPSGTGPDVLLCSGMSGVRNRCDHVPELPK